MKIKFILSALSVLLASVIVTGSMCSSAENKSTEIPEDYINLEDFGGYASDNKDDTEAFKKALATGKNVFLRRGVYTVHETIAMQDQNLLGAGEGTRIVSQNESPNDPIFKIGGVCRLENFSANYDDPLITLKEKKGERVGIWLGNKTMVRPGTVIKEVGVSWVGTGIYAPNEENGGACGLRIDTCTVSKYIYRGVDFQKKGQYGNLISNIYICNLHSADNGVIFADAAFACEGGEYNLQADQLNIEGMPVYHDLLLRNCHNAQFGCVHMEAVRLRDPDTALVKVENSSVRIDGLCAYYIQLKQPNLGLIELGDADSPETNGNYLHVGTLHFKGLGAETFVEGSTKVGFRSANGTSFKIVKRTKGSSGKFNFKLDKYVFYTWLGEADVYESFPCDENGINYLSKGF